MPVAREALACSCILLSVALFVVNSEIMQAESESASVSSYLMIWLCHASMIVLLPVVAALGRGGPDPAVQPLSREVVTLSALHMACNYLFVVALHSSRCEAIAIDNSCNFCSHTISIILLPV